MKKVFIEISDSNLKFFRGLWRSITQSWRLLRAYYSWNHDYGSFWQSLGDVEHVRIGLKSIKYFCWKNWRPPRLRPKAGAAAKDIYASVHVFKHDRIAASYYHLHEKNLKNDSLLIHTQFISVYNILKYCSNNMQKVVWDINTYCK